ncbi:MAG: putative peptidase [Oscillospiraceae bacterium]|nr:putative peptidase [Oscillospiraceae bacterium]
MNKKRIFSEKLNDFIAGRGFYIVLILCVTIIGISGYYLYSALSNGAETVTASAGTELTEAQAGVSVLDPEDAEEAATSQTNTKNAATQSSGTSGSASAGEKTTASASDASAEEATTVPSTAATVFSWPLKGELITDYSVEALAYDVTMGDWRTHNGIDIEASLGDKVKAVADGTVTASYDDDLMGTTLVIDHGGGLESVYCNLAAAPAVNIGDAVTTGEVIGSVGETAIAESAKAPHLHFEMTLNGVSVNPEDYLP